MKRLPFATPILLGAIAVIAAAPAANAVVKKHPKVYTKGTTQMPGGYGRFGQTYTLNDGGPLINFTLMSAEYTVEPYNFRPGTFINSNVSNKLLVIHYRIKNPNKDDLYVSAGGLFQVVDSNNNTTNDSGDQRRLSEKVGLGIKLKPGQGFDDVIDCAVVPAHGPINKIIIEMGQAGTNDRVFRYNLGTAPNVVKPLTAPFVDTSDKSGATALDTISAVVGKTYSAGVCSMSLDNVALQPTQIGNHPLDANQQFLVATVTVTNLTWTSWYHSGDSLRPTLKTDDDKITSDIVVKAKHDDNYDGVSLDGGESISERLLVTVPKDASLKTLTIRYDMGDNGQSRDFVYDVSGVK